MKFTPRSHPPARSGRPALPRGFTLIEVMIAVAIVAILAGIAYPSYLDYLARSRRAEAQSLVMQASQWMERFYSENNSYLQNTAGVQVTDATQFPARFSQSPASGTASYTIAVAATATTYTITATRSGKMINDKCGNFQITHTGLKQLATGTYAASLGTQLQAMQTCWR